MDTEAAKHLLSQSLTRLAAGCNRILFVVLGFYVLTQLIYFFRIATYQGFSLDLFVTMVISVFKPILFLLVARFLMLPVLNNIVYKSLFENGVLKEVELNQVSHTVSDGFRSHGNMNYMIHGGVVILETILGALVPTQRWSYKADFNDRMYNPAFLYPDEVPFVTDEGKGLVLVDSQNEMKHWLVRQPASGSVQAH